MSESMATVIRQDCSRRRAPDQRRRWDEHRSSPATASLSAECRTQVCLRRAVDSAVERSAPSRDERLALLALMAASNVAAQRRGSHAASTMAAVGVAALDTDVLRLVPLLDQLTPSAARRSRKAR